MHKAAVVNTRHISAIQSQNGTDHKNKALGKRWLDQLEVGDRVSIKSFFNGHRERGEVIRRAAASVTIQWTFGVQGTFGADSPLFWDSFRRLKNER
jgi:hypothetical protein